MISVLVPTRGRPVSVRRLAESALETARTEVEFVFYVDDDDPTDTADVCGRYGRALVGPRVVLSEMWNRCAELACHDVRMHCGDDIVFRTAGWDQRVLDEFDRWPDRLVLVHGRDGYKDETLATHGFYHRRWTEVVGYFVPPYFSSDFNDTWWTEVADALERRVYLPDVYTEHMHPAAGKGPLDRTHRERLERHARDDVAGLYRRLASQRAADVAKLRAAIAAHAEAPT